ncbi:TetR family transcriptional regulator [Sphingomonas abaci]|uniref:AcrR family transcriptional regulator n=1 Tax=Sphingomonas abaci TaxID=237611 RepID=A0A7W7AIW3_9SPHN|nr:TetR family transcriptional regulator [Sphingomonas abaci]MBB4617859.1 AcrR family transcriptional regulator [Sphingomonas abaci]
MSIRRRLTPDESRLAALEAARALLIEQGPQGVTLKAVAARIGRTHANLLHHFGSAAGLQQALSGWMTVEIAAAIKAAIRTAQARHDGPGEIVRLVFDAFDAGGAGALASWMILSGDRAALTPILAVVHDLVEELRGDDALAARPIPEETLHLVLLALGDALLGAPMAAALGLPRDAARRLAERAIAAGDPGRSPTP